MTMLRRARVFPRALVELFSEIPITVPDAKGSACWVSFTRGWPCEVNRGLNFPED